MPTFSPTQTTENLASQLRRLRRSNRAQRVASEGSARELVLVAFAVPAAALVVLAVVVLTVLLMAGSGLTGLGTAVASCWLAIHQVPVTISGVTIGVLPLLPTIVVAAATGRFAAAAARSRDTVSELLAVVASAVAGPVLITAMSLAVVMDGTTVLPIQSPNPLLAFVYTLLVHVAGAVGGVVWSRRGDLTVRWGISTTDRRGIRMGFAAVLLLLTVSGVLVTVRLVMRHSTLGELVETGNGFDGYVGLTMLSLMYLPNLMVGALAVLVGSDAHVGTATFGLSAVHGGPVPPLPVLAALPDPPGLGRAGLIGFVVPLAIAGFVAWRCRDLDPRANVRSVGVAAAVAASIVAVLTWMAGGRLGEFGDVGISVTSACVYTLGWIMVVGMLTAAVYGVLPSTKEARSRVVDDADALPDWDDDGFDDDYVIVTDAELDGETDEFEYDDEDAEYEDAESDDFDDFDDVEDVDDEPESDAPVNRLADDDFDDDEAYDLYSAPDQRP